MKVNLLVGFEKKERGGNLGGKARDFFSFFSNQFPLSLFKWSIVLLWF
jgi:hypothetical protein